MVKQMRHGRDSELVLNSTGIHREEILKNWPLTVRNQKSQLEVLFSLSICLNRPQVYFKNNASKC